MGEFAIVNGILLFYQGSSPKVHIPDSVTEISERAFEGCPNLNIECSDKLKARLDL